MSNSHSSGVMAERRALLYEAENILSSYAKRKTFKKTYAKNIPAAKLRSNVFYFSKDNDVPRAIIFGYSICFEAVGISKIKNVINVPEKYRKKAHLGRLGHKLVIEDDHSLRTLNTVCRKLAKKRTG